MKIQNKTIKEEVVWALIISDSNEVECYNMQYTIFHSKGEARYFLDSNEFLKSTGKYRINKIKLTNV